MELKRLLYINLVALLSLLIMFINIEAQNSGRVMGKVTDANSGEALPGANVTIQGTDVGTATDRYGVFRLEKVPLGTQNLVVSYVGYDSKTTEINLTSSTRVVNVDVQLKLTAVKLSDVVVSGLRQGQVKAFNQQMTSGNIKNVLSREEMEKFPDNNTAEVMQRIPGVTISRSLGEGSFVYVRGTEPRLTGVTINGVKMASTQDQGRYTDLGIVNSSELASIEVTKALTPDMDADAIGGVVNLVTRSAFDYEKPTLKLEAGGGYADIEGQGLYKGSIAYSGFLGKNKNWGYSLSGSYFRNNIIAHSDEMDWENNEDINGNVIPWALDDLRFYRYNTRRDHLGLSGDLEYKSDENNKYYVRGMYNLFDDNQSRNMVRVRVSKGDYLSRTVISNARLAFEFQDRNEHHEIWSLAFGGDNQMSDVNLNYNFSYGFGKQDKTDPGQIKSEWQLNEKPDLILDLSDVDFPKYTTTNLTKAYAMDPANWEIDNQDYRDVVINNNTFTGDATIKFPYSLGSLPSEFKAGLKFSVDKKDRTGERWKLKWKGDDYFMSSVASNEQISNFLLDKYTFGPMIDNDKVRAFINKYRGKSDGLQENVQYADTDGPGGDYKSKEGVYAAFLMTNVNIGKLLVIAGLRDEYTNNTYDGYQVIFDNNGDFQSIKPISNDNNYNNIFPYLHLKYKIASTTNARFAVTRSIARPNYFDLAPYNWVNPDDDEITRGNPDLLPTVSTNLDLMFEHYFHGIGVASVGLFMKSLDKVIYNRTTQQVGGAYDGLDIIQPVNGGSATLTGIELNWQQQFTFLPGFLSGFGIYGNYTYTKSKADLLYNKSWSELPGQAADVGNVGLSFEKYNITARISLNYNAAVLYEVGETEDYDRYMDAHTQVDFSGIYKITDYLDFYLDLINITNAPDREYFHVTERPRVNSYYGFSLRSGIKVTL